jgi:hypothetical protein
LKNIKKKRKEEGKRRLCELQVQTPMGPIYSLLTPDNVFIREIQRRFGQLHSNSKSELIPDQFKILKKNRMGIRVLV